MHPSVTYWYFSDENLRFCAWKSSSAKKPELFRGSYDQIMTNDKVTTTTKKKKSDTCTHELHAHEWSPALQRLTFPSCCPGLLRKMLRSCPSFRSAQARALLYSFLLLIDDLLHSRLQFISFQVSYPGSSHACSLRLHSASPASSRFRTRCVPSTWLFSRGFAKVGMHNIAVK